jgi:hypothetical protein
MSAAVKVLQDIALFNQGGGFQPLGLKRFGLSTITWEWHESCKKQRL